MEQSLLSSQMLQNTEESMGNMSTFYEEGLESSTCYSQDEDEGEGNRSKGSSVTSV